MLVLTGGGAAIMNEELHPYGPPRSKPSWDESLAVSFLCFSLCRCLFPLWSPAPRSDQIECLPDSALGETIHAFSAITNGKIFVRGAEPLYCIRGLIYQE